LATLLYGAVCVCVYIYIYIYISSPQVHRTHRAHIAAMAHPLALRRTCFKETTALGGDMCPSACDSDLDRRHGAPFWHWGGLFKETTALRGYVCPSACDSDLRQHIFLHIGRTYFRVWLRPQPVAYGLLTPQCFFLTDLDTRKFITGQNEREESTQNTTVTKSAACASYKIKATT
jgi:hypothetical protein